MIGPELWVDGHAVPALGVALLGTAVGYFAGMFGIGGGFIMTPMLVVIFKVPLPVAVGSGLCQMVGTSLVAFLRHRKLGQGEVRFDLLVIPGSLVGVEIGTRVLTALAARTSLTIGGHSLPMATLVVESAYIVLLAWVAISYLQHGRDDPEYLHLLRPGPLTRARLGVPVDLPKAHLRGMSAVLIAYLGVGLGFLSGLLGIGGGVALNPVLTYGYGFPIRQTVGTGIMVLFITAVTGTVSHSLRGHVNLALALVLLVGGTVAAQFGAIMSRRVAAGTLSRLQAVLLFSAVAAVVWDLVSRFL